MKNKITILVLSLMTLSLFSQEKLDSTISEYFDGVNFILDNKNTYTYDSNFNLLIDTSFDRNLNTWDLDNVLTNDFDINNNLISFTNGLIDSSYNNLIKWDLTYNNTNKLTSANAFRWNGQWYNDIKFDVIRNSNDLPTDLIIETWDTIGNIWENTGYYTYTYNTSDQIQQIIISKWDTIGNTYVFQSKGEYTYTGNNYTRILYSRWNSAALIWGINNQSLYSYDSYDNPLTVINASFDNDSLLFYENSKTDYIYDNTKPINTIANPFNDVFYELGFNTLAIKSKLLSSITYYNFNNNNLSVWEIQNKKTHYYSNYTPATPNAIKEFSSTSFKTYPNPTTESLYFDIENDVTIEIYNTDGQKVIIQNLNNAINKVTVNKLTNGLYYFKILDGKDVLVGKFLKQ